MALPANMAVWLVKGWQTTSCDGQTTGWASGDVEFKRKKGVGMKFSRFFELTRAAAGRPAGKVLIAGMTLLASCLESPAQIHTNAWYGCGGNGNWSTAGNWQGNSLPVEGNVLEFRPTACQKSATNDYSDRVYNTINIQAANYHLYGNPVTLLGNVVADYAAGGTSTVNMDIRAARGGLWGLEIFYSINVLTNNSALQIIGDILMDLDTAGGGIHVVGAGDLTISGTISGGYALFKEGTGDLTLLGSAANTFTGAVYVTAGILRLNKTAVIPPGIVVGRVSVPGNLTIGSGTSGLISDVVWLGYHNQIANTSEVSIFSSGQLDLNGYSDTVGPLTMTGGSVVTGTGTLTLNGDVACEPAANVSGISGKLALGSGSARNFDVSAGAHMQVDAVVSGASGIALVKTNAGELILTAANTYDGPTVVAGGTLTVMHAQALGSNTNGTIVTGGTLKLLNTAVSDESLTVNGKGMLEATGASCAWNGAIALNTNLEVEVNTSGALVLSNAISGSGELYKGWPGRLTLTGAAANTYDGATIVNDGELVLSKPTGTTAVPGFLQIGGGAASPVVRLMASQQIADTSPLTIVSSALLDLNGFSETIGLLVGSGQVALGSGTLTVSNEVGSYWFNGVISGSGKFIKAGAGSFTLNGTNTYSGTTTISNGTLCVNGSLSNSAVSLVATNCTLSGTGVVKSVNVAKGIISPGSSAGILISLGTVTIDPGTLQIELNGTNAGTGYDQLRALGAVNLGKATLNVTCNFAPPVGATFKVIDKVSGGAVSGVFNGLPEGKVFAVSGLPFQISYVGGDGNDVVLTRVQSSSAVSNLVAHLTGSQVQLQAQGTAGLRYVIEATPYLNPPIPWQPIATNTADGTGLVVFTEPDPSLYAQRFYRVASP